MSDNSVVIECTDQMIKLLDALVLSGLFGPNRDTAAQRLLELKMWEISVDSFDKLVNKKS